MSWLIALAASSVFWALAIWGALASFASEQGRVGRAPLFLLTQRFQVSAYIESAPQTEHLVAVLWDVPRRRLRNLSAVLSATRVDSVQVVLLNETCVTNGVCEPRDALFGYTSTSLRRAVRSKDERLRVLIQRETRSVMSSLTPMLEGRRLLLNPLLETTLNAQGWETVATWIREEAPGVLLVWNPRTENKAEPASADYIEHHGDKQTCKAGKRQIANLDGYRATTKEMRDWLLKTSECGDSLLWVAADNCRAERESAFVPPSRRVCNQSFAKVRATVRR